MSETDTCTKSPCVRNCCLNDDLTCLGCFRSLEEIREWGVADDPRRKTILQTSQRRAQAYRLLVGSEWA